MFENKGAHWIPAFAGNAVERFEPRKRHPPIPNIDLGEEIWTTPAAQRQPQLQP